MTIFFHPSHPLSRPLPLCPLLPHAQTAWCIVSVGITSCCADLPPPAGWMMTSPPGGGINTVSDALIPCYPEVNVCPAVCCIPLHRLSLETGGVHACPCIIYGSIRYDASGPPKVNTFIIRGSIQHDVDVSIHV